MAKRIRVPLWEDNHGLLAWPSRPVEGRKPAAIDYVIFRIGRAYRRRESQKLCRAQLAAARPLVELFELLLLPHVGWKKLGQSFLDMEIVGSLVTEEAFAVADNAPIQLAEIALGASVVVFGSQDRKASVGLGPETRPLNSPLQRTHDAVCITRGEMGLPRKHPLLPQFAHRNSNLANLGRSSDFHSSHVSRGRTRKPFVNRQGWLRDLH